MSQGRAFWSEECPARGPGLTHAHWHKCAEHHTDPTHYIDQCCECGGRASEWGVRINAETIPDYSVARRMQEMGLMAGLPVPPDKKDDELVEPKAITGHGPQGSKYGRGRMGSDGLSPQDKARLHFYVRYVRRMTHEDRPDIDAHIP